MKKAYVRIKEPGLPSVRLVNSSWVLPALPVTSLAAIIALAENGVNRIHRFTCLFESFKEVLPDTAAWPKMIHIPNVNPT
ncbi:hypothetical protein GCM10007362_18430 [Saccharibacillus endophyticus]|uniref:Uncharacterized protein n=1 Tax=Saccharibacillus endophyticus TaxID=2060666 RepID=A0ABQ1ZS43_9BACL|nr:hypothetical protein GCM10007362_18430 [Saccharibacillus endophyticus]